MIWTNELKGNTLHWLLEPSDAGVRYLALRDLCDLPSNDTELRAARRLAHSQGMIPEVMTAMDSQGFWVKPGAGYNPKYKSTVWALILLGQLGADVREDNRLARACAYLIEHALTPRGQFSYNGTPSGTIDCLQGNLCWAMTVMGFAHPRLEQAFDWMARSVTGDGIAPASDRQAEWRYYAYKCGPGFACGVNEGQPCAWGAVKVMLAMGALPPEQRTDRIQRAIQTGKEFLLSIDPVSAAYPSGLNDKPNTSWWKLGFPVFYVTDVLQVAEALVGLGCGDDPRLANTRKWILEKQDDQGRWRMEYPYGDKTYGSLGQKGHPNKWVTLRALRVIKATHSLAVGI